MVCCAAWIGHSGLRCGCSNSHFLLSLWLEAEGRDMLKAHSCLILVKWFPGICEWEVKIKCQILSLGYDKAHFCQVWVSLPVNRFHTVPLIIPSSLKFWIFSVRSLLQTFEVLILSFVQSPDYGTILSVGCNVAIWEQVSIGGTTVGHFVIVCAL